MLTKEDLLTKRAEFVWMFDKFWFVEVIGGNGNYVWSDPEYDGDNTFIHTNHDYQQFVKAKGYRVGRGLGRHFIKDYCGDEIIVIG